MISSFAALCSTSRVLSSIIWPKCCTENFVAFSYIASPLRFLHPIIFIPCNKSDIPRIVGMVAIPVFLILTRNKTKQNTGPCICLYRFSLLYSVMFASFPFLSLLQLSASGSISPLQLFCWQIHIKICSFLTNLKHGCRKSTSKTEEELKVFSRIKGFEEVVHHQENCNFLLELVSSTNLQETSL